MLENLEQFEVQDPQSIYGGCSIVEENAEGI